MSDLPQYDDQLATDVAHLFLRAGDTLPSSRDGLVEAAMAAGETRILARRRRHLAGIAASAALVGSLMTASVVAITQDGGDGIATTPVAVQFGLSSDEMAPALTRALVDSGQVSEAAAASEVAARGSLPAWISDVEGAFEVTLPQGGNAVRTASATYQGGEGAVEVAVVIEHRNTTLASMADVLPTTIAGPTGGMVQRTSAGVVLYQGGKPDGAANHLGVGAGPGIATLMTDEGWVVRVLTPDLGTVSLKVLAQVAQDRIWLGDPERRAVGKSTMDFAATSEWPTISAPTCAGLTVNRDTIVRVTRFDGTCLTVASRDVTTLFVTTYAGEAPLGETWRSQTEAWKEVGGHAVRRLSDGPLIRLSSVYVDALVCASCDEVAVAMGPMPAKVRAVLESVQD